MKALSIRQPWAWLIIMGHKPIENRTWKTDFRGRIMLHASAGMTRKEYADAVAFAAEANPLVLIPPYDTLKRGGIIGQVTIMDCVSQSKSPWFVGPFGFVLTDPYPLPFRPYTGALGFFETL